MPDSLDFTEPQVLRTSSSTDAKKLASSIISHYEKDKHIPIIVRSIGAGALNQGVKAIVIANKFFVGQGIVLAVIPAFNDVEDATVTSIELRIRYVNL